MGDPMILNSHSYTGLPRLAQDPLVLGSKLAGVLVDFIKLDTPNTLTRHAIYI